MIGGRLSHVVCRKRLTLCGDGAAMRAWPFPKSPAFTLFYARLYWIIIDYQDLQKTAQLASDLCIHLVFNIWRTHNTTSACLEMFRKHCSSHFSAKYWTFNLFLPCSLPPPPCPPPSHPSLFHPRSSPLILVQPEEAHSASSEDV